MLSTLIFQIKISQQSKHKTVKLTEKCIFCAEEQFLHLLFSLHDRQSSSTELLENLLSVRIRRCIQAPFEFTDSNMFSLNIEEHKRHSSSPASSDHLQLSRTSPLCLGCLTSSALRSPFEAHSLPPYRRVISLYCRNKCLPSDRSPAICLPLKLNWISFLSSY